MRLVLVGPPGAGKGTQAQFISSHFTVPKISTGDIFRANVSEGTELGLEARKYMDAGDLVPDEVTIAMVKDRLSHDDVSEGFLLDGFPRTVHQAEVLDGMLAEHTAAVDVVLELVVDDEEVVRRLSGRRRLARRLRPPRRRGHLRPLQRRAVPARRRQRRHHPAPARRLRRPDVAADRLLRRQGPAPRRRRHRSGRRRDRPGHQRVAPFRRLTRPPERMMQTTCSGSNSA